MRGSLEVEELKFWHRVRFPFESIEWTSYGKRCDFTNMHPIISPSHLCPPSFRLVFLPFSFPLSCHPAECHSWLVGMSSLPWEVPWPRAPQWPSLQCTQSHLPVSPGSCHWLRGWGLCSLLYETEVSVCCNFFSHFYQLNKSIQVISYSLICILTFLYHLTSKNLRKLTLNWWWFSSP